MTQERLRQYPHFESRSDTCRQREFNARVGEVHLGKAVGNKEQLEVHRVLQIEEE